VGTQTNPEFWLGTYADLGLVLGLIGIVAYVNQTRLPTYYYTVSLWLYSGLPVGFVILSGDAWVWGLLIAVVITLLTAYLSDLKLGYSKSMPGEVYSYAKNRTIIHSNYDLGYEVEIDLLDALLR
jgi:Ca2+/Na+ antiporter